MNSIQRYGDVNLPEKIAQKLSPQEQHIARLTFKGSENPRYCEMNQHEVKSLIENILLKAKVKLGGKANTPEENLMLMNVIDEDLNSKFPNATRSEIYAALDAGLDGMFLEGDDTKIFFNPSNLVRWIRAWVDKVKRPVMLKVNEGLNGLPTEVPVPNEMEMIKLSFKRFVQACVDLKEKDTVWQDHGQIIYNLLVKFGRINEVSKEDLERAGLHSLFVADVTRDKSEKNTLTRVLDEVRKKEHADHNSQLFGVAARKIVADELNIMREWDEESVYEYLEELKCDIMGYFKENFYEL